MWTLTAAAVLMFVLLGIAGLHFLIRSAQHFHEAAP